MGIPTGDVARAIATALKEYTDPVCEAIRKEVDDTATDIKRDVQANSPVGQTGRYKKGWSVYKRDNAGVTSRTVHNRSDYQLVHLLEHGHAKRGGGRVAAIPHVAPAAEPRLEKMITNIKRIIENGG